MLYKCYGFDLREAGFKEMEAFERNWMKRKSEMKQKRIVLMFEENRVQAETDLIFNYLSLFETHFLSH